MIPSRTVENYLKTIFQAQVALLEPHDLVPMGQIATALGVVPGTATTMVKALAESGLVTYEPYAGVRLTNAGEKLAAMVLRRHRLIELFLVQVMGMNWTEVHQEAEQLEHAVSDRLIERMDQMLGHPAADPHGDPIPGPEGTVKHQEYHNLLTCPMNTPLIVTRVTDQDAEFLRFVESSELMPGQAIEIEARDAAADSVLVRRTGERRITVGTRAASKLLVRVAQVLLIFLLGADSAGAQTPPTDRNRPFEILDNSFLVEEAFNQEPGIFQNILGVLRFGASDWEATFTQEWPIGTKNHQFSFTLPIVGLDGDAGLGDMLINYRFQAMDEGRGRPAFAPRLSVILPSGSDRTGTGVVGWQVNLPFSKQTGNFYWHWNAGFTHLPGVDRARQLGVGTPGASDAKVGLTTPHLAGSAIWRMQPMVNLLLEAVADFEESIGGLQRTTRDAILTISPGMRTGWNIHDQQIIVGLAVPLRFSDDNTGTAVFAYCSYELPFRKN